jgi:hypothetical protein
MSDSTTSTEPAAAVSGAIPVTVEQYRATQVAEYNTYVAATTIDINGARAFNPGDPVPTSHVETGVLDPDQVHKITTKAGRAAAGLPEKG